MGEPALLEPPETDVTDAEVVPIADDGPEEVPSVFSVTTRYIVGRVDISPPAEDGSRILRLHSGNAAAVVEANLSPQLCEFISGKLVEVDVIEEVDAEIVEDAPATP